MDNKNNVGPIYIKVIRSANPETEKLITEKFNPTLNLNPQGLRKEQIKKVKKSVCVDSSYYLG